MRNDDRRKLSKINVDVKSYGSSAVWLLETDFFKTELTDGESNVIDFKKHPVEKSPVSNKKKVSGFMFGSFLNKIYETREKIVLLRSLLI